MGSNKISPINTWPHVSALFTKAVLIGFGVRDTWRVWSGLRKIRLRGTDAVRLLTNKCPFSRGIGRETRVFGEMLVDVVFRGGCVYGGLGGAWKYMGLCGLMVHVVKKMY